MDSFAGARPRTAQAGLAFRVECHDRNNKHYNECLVRGGLGGLAARNDRFVGGSFGLSSDLHLAGARVDTPFISFWGTLPRTLKFRREMLEGGGKDIVVVVVWLGGMPRVYDGQEMTKWVENRRGLGFGRRPIECHEDELLVFQGVAAAEHRVLACIYGDAAYGPDDGFVSPGQLRVREGYTMVCPDPDAVLAWLDAWLEEGGGVSDAADISLLIIVMALEACRRRS